MLRGAAGQGVVGQHWTCIVLGHLCSLRRSRTFPSPQPACVVAASPAAVMACVPRRLVGLCVPIQA